MTKSSIDYVELSGLRVAVSNLETFPKSDTQTVIDWMKKRIKELEDK
jgi:hypothetical protein